MTARKRFVLAAGWLLAIRGILSADQPLWHFPGDTPLPLPSAPTPVGTPVPNPSMPVIDDSTPFLNNPGTVIASPPATSEEGPGEAEWHTAGCGSAPCDCCDTPNYRVNYLFPQNGRLRFRGWADAGGAWNTTDPPSHFNGPYNATDRDEFQFNQGYGILEMVLPQDGSFGVGGRVDALYGFDYNLAQSRGFEVRANGAPRWNSSQYYGVTVPQAYGEIGSNDLSVKVGHFYSIVGYESVMSPENFFYTHSYSYMFAGPFTHWGAMGTWKPGDHWQIQAAAVNGWDALDQTDNRAAFMGSIKYTGDCKNWWTSFAIITGDENTNSAGLPNVANGIANRTRYSYILDLNLTDKLEYVFHHWLGLQEDGAPGGGTALWYGIDQYAYYKLTDELKAGMRFEWFRDQDGTRVGLDRPANPNVPPLPGNYFSLSGGINWTPCSMPNLTVRPELRWDWATDTVRRPYDDGRKTNQFLLATDVIFRF